MKISSIRVQHFADHQRIDVDIGPFCLWFRVPAGRPINPRDASPFVVAALIPSMLLGETLEVDPSLAVSPQLLDNLPRIQAIYHCWNPIFTPIDIVCDTHRWSALQPDVEQPMKNASFFSGGVDGSYTLIRHEGSIDDLILINGFDFSMDSETWEQMVARNRRFASAMHKTLVPVETNFKAFTAAFGIARYANFGAVLASIGLLLGYRKVFCSSSDTYRVLRSIGSHPLLDPLWGTEHTAVVHTGLEADRADKLALICQNQAAIDNLWVCWKDPRANCGRCSKCVRTAIALELLGYAPDIFAVAPDTRQLRKVPIKGIEELQFYELFLTRAEAAGSPLAGMLRRTIFVFKTREYLKGLRDLFMRGAKKSLANSRNADDLKVQISVHPRYSDPHVLALVRNRIARGEDLESEPPLGSVFTLTDSPSAV